MWDGRLKPGFLSRSLRKPGPYCCDVQDAQVLKQDAPAEPQGLNDEVIEKVVGRFREVGGQNGGDVTRIVDDLRNDIDDAGRNGREHYELDEEEGEIKVLRYNLTFTPSRCAH